MNFRRKMTPSLPSLTAFSSLLPLNGLYLNFLLCLPELTPHPPQCLEHSAVVLSLCLGIVCVCVLVSCRYSHQHVLFAKHGGWGTEQAFFILAGCSSYPGMLLLLPSFFCLFHCFDAFCELRRVTLPSILGVPNPLDSPVPVFRSLILAASCARNMKQVQGQIRLCTRLLTTFDKEGLETSGGRSCWGGQSGRERWCNMRPGPGVKNWKLGQAEEKGEKQSRRNC